MTIKIFSVINLSKESPQSDSVVTSAQLAFDKIKLLLAQGADFIDIGGRSSGSKTVMVDDSVEQSRLDPVFQLIKQDAALPISLDTWSVQTALKHLDNIQVLNYTSTYYPETLLQALSKSKCKVVVNYSAAENPYALRSAIYKPFDIKRVLGYFETTLEILNKKGVKVLAIDPNLGVWHSQVPNEDKPAIQRMIIEHIPEFKKLAPVFIVAPRIVAPNTRGHLNMDLTKLIIKNGVDFIRTHDLEEIKLYLSEK